MNTSTTLAKPAPAVAKITIASLDNVCIATSDGKTINVGSVTNAIANKNASPQALHDALTAFHDSALIAAKQAGSDAATAAMEPAHGFLASLFAKSSLTPADVKAGAAAVADVRQTSVERKLTKAQKAADDASAALAELKAQQVPVVE